MILSNLLLTYKIMEINTNEESFKSLRYQKNLQGGEKNE